MEECWLRPSYVESTNVLEILVAYKTKDVLVLTLMSTLLAAALIQTPYTKTHAKRAIPVFRHVDLTTEGEEMREQSIGP